MNMESVIFDAAEVRKLGRAFEETRYAAGLAFLDFGKGRDDAGVAIAAGKGHQQIGEGKNAGLVQRFKAHFAKAFQIF